MNKIIEYRRNRAGEFVNGRDMTLRHIGILCMAIALTGAIAYTAQRFTPFLPEHEALAQELPEGCKRGQDGLECDFTTQDTINSLRKHIPLRDVPEEITSTSTDPAIVEAKIRRIAWEEGYNDPDYLVELARCESRLDVYAVNGNGNKPASSVDRGPFQINSHWQKGVPNDKAFDLDWATRWTIGKLKNGGHGLWMCDPIIRKRMGRA
jgi:hypothetical protein